MIIRSEKPQDHEAIHRVNRLAFGREEEASLVAALRRSDAYIPGLSLVAEENGGIIGHILFTRIHIKGKTRSVEALALAPMCVLPEMQRRGIGSALVEIGLEECAEFGHRIVIVVGHPEFYPRFGFRPAAESGIQAPFPVPSEAFMALALVPGALSWVSGIVVYPPEFSSV
jgi:putative acetyltransferase